MSNFLALCHLGRWFVIAGYKITKMIKWKRVCGGNFTINNDMIVGGECTRVKLAVTSPSRHFRDLAKKTPIQKRADKLKKYSKKHIMLKS